MQQTRNNETIRRSKATDSKAAKLIALCSDQITAAIDEACREIDELSRSVLDSAGQANALVAATRDQNSNADRRIDSAETHAEALRNTVRSANMRLQFADRLQQRLSNVSEILAGFATLVRSIDFPITDASWSVFLDTARATFTMEEERRMFDAIFYISLPASSAVPDKQDTLDSFLFDDEVTNEGE